MSESISPSVETLLEHAGWIRALAGRLVRDPQAAEDVAQDALIAAAAGGPRERGSLRAWLAAVVANSARARWRTDTRRTLREARAARAEALPSAHDVVERAEMQRKLVEAVLELDEPYRTAILLRFYEEREPRDIARMLGVPDATVRTHVARGLTRLRARLDRTHGGDRTAWASLLLPVATNGGAVPTTFLGALLVNTQLKLALAAVVIVAAALLITRGTSREEAQAVSTATMPADAPAKSATDLPLLAAGSTGVTRSEAPVVSSPSVTGKPSVAAALPRLRGRVLDQHGTLRSGVPVALQLASQDLPIARAVSNASGEFEMERPREKARIVADDPALVTLFAGLVEGSATSIPAVVVAPATMLRGFVVDAEGASIADARVRVECPEELRTRIPHDLDLSLAQDWSTRSGAQGGYMFEALPNVPDARLECTHDGFVPFSVALGDVIGGSFVITLVRPGVKEAVVRGRVVDASNVPVQGAYVSLGAETTKSDENGLFAMNVDDPKGLNAQFKVPATRLVATRKGFLPGEAVAPVVDGKAAWPQLVTLRLGAPALTITGTVKDHLGKTRAGLRVFVTDPAFFGAVDGNPTQLENIIAGAPPRMWRFVETDAEGKFTIDGLCARAYGVRAMEPDTLLRVDAKDVQAGTSGLVLAMPRDALYPRVAGVVRTHDGKPVAEAHIFPMCDAFQARMNGQIIGTSHDALDGVTTDADGRFEILDVPKSLVYLRVEREDVLPLEYGRYVEGDDRFTDSIRELPRDRIDNLDIRVDRRAHVQIELADAALADEFSLLDDQGHPLELSVFIGNGRREGPRSPIVEGKSYVTAGTDRAKTLVIYKDKAEVGRRNVKLSAGETTKIRW